VYTKSIPTVVVGILLGTKRADQLLPKTMTAGDQVWEGMEMQRTIRKTSLHPIPRTKSLARDDMFVPVSLEKNKIQSHP